MGKPSRNILIVIITILSLGELAMIAGGGRLLSLRSSMKFAASFDERLSIKVGGVTRNYLLHSPANLPAGKSAPLVLVFHGGGGHDWNMPGFTHFDDLADQEGFLVAYPDAVNRHWNDSRGESDADDVGFTRELIAALERAHAIDPHRVYATGISNGGFFSNRLACELGDKIAAIASVAATMPKPLVAECKPARPISVLYIQGTDDPLVPINGGTIGFVRGRGRGENISLADSAKFWRSIDGITVRAQLKGVPGPRRRRHHRPSRNLDRRQGRHRSRRLHHRRRRPHLARRRSIPPETNRWQIQTKSESHTHHLGILPNPAVALTIGAQLLAASPVGARHTVPIQVPNASPPVSTSPIEFPLTAKPFPPSRVYTATAPHPVHARATISSKFERRTSHEESLPIGPAPGVHPVRHGLARRAPHNPKTKPLPSYDMKGQSLQDLDDMHKKFVRLAEATPAEKFSWRPSPDTRSVSEAFLHVCNMNYGMPASIGATPVPGYDGKTLEKSTVEKAKVIAAAEPVLRLRA